MFQDTYGSNSMAPHRIIIEKIVKEYLDNRFRVRWAENAPGDHLTKEKKIFLTDFLENGFKKPWMI